MPLPIHPTDARHPASLSHTLHTANRTASAKEGNTRAAGRVTDSLRFGENVADALQRIEDAKDRGAERRAYAAAAAAIGSEGEEAYGFPVVKHAPLLVAASAILDAVVEAADTAPAGTPVLCSAHWWAARALVLRQRCLTNQLYAAPGLQARADALFAAARERNACGFDTVAELAEARETEAKARAWGVRSGEMDEDDGADAEDGGEDENGGKGDAELRHLPAPLRGAVIEGRKAKAAAARLALGTDFSSRTGRDAECGGVNMTRLRARLLLECGLHRHFSFDVNGAKLWFAAAKVVTGLAARLTGAMGRRTKFQTFDVSQMVLLARSDAARVGLCDDDIEERRLRKELGVDALASSSSSSSTSSTVRDAALEAALGPRREDGGALIELYRNDPHIRREGGVGEAAEDQEGKGKAQGETKLATVAETEEHAGGEGESGERDAAEAEDEEDPGEVDESNAIEIVAAGTREVRHAKDSVLMEGIQFTAAARRAIENAEGREGIGGASQSEGEGEGEGEGTQTWTRRALHPLDQCVVLALCIDVRNQNANYGLTREQMTPYVDRVVQLQGASQSKERGGGAASGGSVEAAAGVAVASEAKDGETKPKTAPLHSDAVSRWSIHSCALVVRAWLEYERYKTRSRALLQLQVLVDQAVNRVSPGMMAGASAESHKDAPPAQRMPYVHQLVFPAHWEMRRQLADRYRDSGVLRSAAEGYAALGLWDEVAMCLVKLKEDRRATEMIEAELSQNPGKARLWFALALVKDAQPEGSAAAGATAKDAADAGGAAAQAAAAVALEAAEMSAGFEAASSFFGARGGRVFKTGVQGLGYYEDLRLPAGGGSERDSGSASEGLCAGDGSSASSDGLRSPSIMSSADCLHEAWRVSGGRFVDAKIELGNRAFSRGDLEECLGHLSAAVAVRSHSPAALFRMGVAAMMLGRSAEALSHLRRCVAVRPEDGDAWGNIGAILHRMSNNATSGAAGRDIGAGGSRVRLLREEAVKAFEEALKHGKRSAKAHQNLLNACILARRYQKAMSTLRLMLARSVVPTPALAAAADAAPSVRTREVSAVLVVARAVAMSLARPGEGAELAQAVARGVALDGSELGERWHGQGAGKDDDDDDDENDESDENDGKGAAGSDETKGLGGLFDDCGEDDSDDDSDDDGGNRALPSKSANGTVVAMSSAAAAAGAQDSKSRSQTVSEQLFAWEANGLACSRLAVPVLHVIESFATKPSLVAPGNGAAALWEAFAVVSAAKGSMATAYEVGWEEWG